MARLPVPGSDEGEWGGLLNDFLTQAHNDDGTIKSSAVAGAIGDATATDKGVVQLAGDLGGTAAAPTVPGLAAKASAAQQIIAGTGLTGGGDLTAHRTLAVDFGTGATQAAPGNHTHATLTPTSRQITAGTGLTGGGNFTADRTLAVDFGTGATQVAAGNHTHAASTVRQTQTWAWSGIAQVVAGTGRWYNRTGAAVTIYGVWAAVGTAPTGTGIIIDVNLNGTTIFTTQANRPTVPVASNSGTLATPDVTTVPDGGYLVVDVDQVGSTTPGNDLTVGVIYS